MFARIESRIAEIGLAELGSRRRLTQIDSVMLHRIGPDLNGAPATNAMEVSAWFRAHPEVLGTTMMPYTFIITRAGVIEQSVWLATRTPHALRWNTRAVGVGLIGDFRKQRPASEQIDAAAALIIRLQDGLRRPLAIYGHTMWHPSSPAETTTTPGKACPGKHFEEAYREILRQVKEVGQVHLGSTT